MARNGLPMEEATEKNGELLSLREHGDDVGVGDSGEDDRDDYDKEPKGGSEHSRNPGNVHLLCLSSVVVVASYAAAGFSALFTN